MAKYRWIRIAKYATYSILLILLFSMQSAPGLFEVGGIRPMLIIPFVIAVSVFEGEITGAVYALAGGLLCDFTSTMLLGVNAFIFFVFAVITGLLSRYLLRPTIVNGWFFSTLTAILRAAVEYYLMYSMWGYEYAPMMFWKKLFPVAIYTIIITPILFYLIRFIYLKFSRLLKV